MELDIIDKYFKKDSDKLNFIELKDLDVFKLDVNHVPLPLMSDVLASGISDGSLEDGVNIELIIDGIICTLGIDGEFKYKEEYIKILRALTSNLGDYIFLKGLKLLEDENEDRANLYFRAIKNIDEDHVLGRFNYALALERIANRKYNEDFKNAGDKFLKEATYEFESVLDIDENYDLAYYKLGYHYKHNGQSLKSKLMWEKFIKLTNDELRKQEIREEISVIEDDVKLETAMTYLSHSRFEEALEHFLDIDKKYERWDIKYFIGFSYANLEDSLNAIKYYEAALELNDLEEGVYNDLGIELFKVQDLKKAVDVFTKGLGKMENSYKLYYNRGLAYIELKDMDKGYSDINRAYEINPADKNIENTKLTLERNLGI